MASAILEMKGLRDVSPTGLEVLEIRESLKAMVVMGSSLRGRCWW